MGIQHFEGRATWVLKFGKDGEREIRFALSDENTAVNFFFKAIRRINDNVCVVRVVHDSHILMTVNVSAKDVKEFQDLDGDIKHLIGIVKNAI